MNNYSLIPLAFLLAATSAASAHVHHVAHDDGLQTGRSVHVERVDPSAAPSGLTTEDGGRYSAPGTATGGPSGGLPDSN